MLTENHPLAKALIAQIAPLQQQNPVRPELLHYEGVDYVVKFARKEAGRTWREICSALFGSLLFKIWINPKHLRLGGIAYEAQRLIELKQHNIAVPDVLLLTPDYLVMTHTGQSVQSRLNQDPKNPILLHSIVESLVELHTRGQWHGGAQVRNLTIQEQKIYRIDFEENTGNAMPLHIAQAYDVLLCFNSLLHYLHDDLKTGSDLLKHYLLSAPNPLVIHALQQVNRHLHRLQRLLLPLMSRKMRNSKDVRRTVFFAQILQQALSN